MIFLKKIALFFFIVPLVSCSQDSLSNDITTTEGVTGVKKLLITQFGDIEILSIELKTKEGLFNDFSSAQIEYIEDNIYKKRIYNNELPEASRLMPVYELDYTKSEITKIKDHQVKISDLDFNLIIDYYGNAVDALEKENQYEFYTLNRIIFYKLSNNKIYSELTINAVENGEKLEGVNTNETEYWLREFRVDELGKIRWN